MANALSAVDSKHGGKTWAPFMAINLDLAFTDYATGGIDILALLNASDLWKALKLDASSIFAGIAALDADAEGVTRVAEFLPTGKLVLKKVTAGALAEQANGAIGATVNCTLTVFLS